MTGIADWTPEQLENAMNFGVCLDCGMPRESRIVETTDPTSYGQAERLPRKVTTMKLVCSSGCLDHDA